MPHQRNRVKFPNTDILLYLAITTEKYAEKTKNFSEKIRKFGFSHYCRLINDRKENWELKLYTRIGVDYKKH